MSEDAVIEWGTAEQIFTRFGLSRGTLYKLAEAGRIRSALVKTRANARKGIRLFSVESVRKLLEANVISS